MWLFQQIFAAILVYPFMYVYKYVCLYLLFTHNKLFIKNHFIAISLTAVQTKYFHVEKFIAVFVFIVVTTISIYWKFCCSKSVIISLKWERKKTWAQEQSKRHANNKLCKTHPQAEIHINSSAEYCVKLLCFEMEMIETTPVDVSSVKL